MISSFSTNATIDVGCGATSELFKREISPTLVRKGVIYYSNCRDLTSYPNSKL